MATIDDRHGNEAPTAEMLLACDICLKEIPVSETGSREATDYVMHFCGLECYDRWRGSSCTTSRPGVLIK